MGRHVKILTKFKNDKATQNQKNLLNHKEGFYFQGVKFCNSLPIKISQIQAYNYILKLIKMIKFEIL